MTRPILVVMRLAEMARVHPAMITSICGNCGHKVGIYPSGQRVIVRDPATLVVCSHCTDPTTATGLAPGAREEVAQSIPNPERKR